MFLSWGVGPRGEEHSSLVAAGNSRGRCLCRACVEDVFIYRILHLLLKLHLIGCARHGIPGTSGGLDQVRPRGRSRGWGRCGPPRHPLVSPAGRRCGDCRADGLRQGQRIAPTWTLPSPSGMRRGPIKRRHRAFRRLQMKFEGIGSPCTRQRSTGFFIPIRAVRLSRERTVAISAVCVRSREA